MTNLSPEFCSRAAAARRAANMSQSALAREIGCNQSALSMFEAGYPTKLSGEIVERLAKRLGIEVLEPAPSTHGDSPSPWGGAPQLRAFCPDSGCLSNIPYCCGGRLFFRPAHVFAAAGGGAHCVHCGEVLETACPACGAPLNEGACCAACGAPYVAAPPMDCDPSAWAARRRAEIEEVAAIAMPGRKL